VPAHPLYPIDIWGVGCGGRAIFTPRRLWRGRALRLSARGSPLWTTGTNRNEGGPVCVPIDILSEESQAWTDQRLIAGG
jgi:hypothetical protein